MTAETVRLLVARAGLRERIAAMFAGERINLTEDRAVLHVALRAPQGSQVLVDGHDVVPEVHAVLARMRGFAEQVRSGRWLGHTGRPIRNLVNLGIGGSDLGPAMASTRSSSWSGRSTCPGVLPWRGAQVWAAVNGASTRVTVRTTAGGGTVVTAERFTETAAILACAVSYWTA